ncbi:MAG: DNA recombination protein RmuC [Planctomycetota bacterium]|nr:DNA recombination protein RmuC [Planctomycetota bacterium]
MDAVSFVVGTAFGLLLGGAVGFVVAKFMARASNASALVTAEHARTELQTTRTERDALRTQHAAAQQSEASVKATASSLQTQLAETRTQLQQAGAEYRVLSNTVSQAQQQLRTVEAESQAKEKHILDLKSTVEQARTTLIETFKATGADVLKATSETFLRQAKEQFEGHAALSAKDLAAKQTAIDDTLKPLRDQIAKQEALVRELSEKREGDSKSLGEQLKQIADLQQKASTAAHTLSVALRDNRQRGRWGEIALRNIAELAGLAENVDFSEQSSMEDADGARLRPDMTVRLPGDRCVPIDAKVPMVAYFDSLDANLSDAERVTRRLAHAQALRSHVRTLASRDYAKALGAGVEITVLFVPVESGLIAALEEDATIFQEALEKRIIITTASTLLALLRTCALQWQQAKINVNARAIGEKAKELLGRINTFADHLGKVGSGLETAAKSYNQAVGSFNSRLLPGARDTASLAGTLEVPEELEHATTTLRDVSQASLPPSAD